jgi:hypothetical protein
VQEAFRSLVQDGIGDQIIDDDGVVVPMDMSKVASGVEPQLLEADPKNLTESHGVSHQEK